MQQIVDMLRQYEDAAIVPLVEAAKLEPIRRQDDFIFGPGTIAAFVNGAHSFNSQDGRIFWTPLVVQYTDRNRSTGSVYRINAMLNPATQDVVLQGSEISGVMSLIRVPEGIEWRNPLTNRLYRQIRTRDADMSNQVLLNSWQLFCGGILPMLLNESYWFVPEPERQNFQVVMLHHLRKLYEGLIP